MVTCEITGQDDLCIKQGDAQSNKYTWTDEDGNAINITGYRVVMEIKEYSGATVLLTLDSETPTEIDLTNAVTGIFIVNITKTQSLTLTPQLYEYGIKILDLDSDPLTIIEGEFKVEHPRVEKI